MLSVEDRDDENTKQASNQNFHKFSDVSQAAKNKNDLISKEEFFFHGMKSRKGQIKEIFKRDIDHISSCRCYWFPTPVPLYQAASPSTSCC